MNFKSDLINRVFCRIKPSSINGVGVFAIRDILKGIDPMQECRKFEFESMDVKDISDLPLSLQKLVRDMCPENEGKFDIPSFSLNEIGISYYLNHSSEPNMEYDEESGNFVTLRAIKEGEELTVDYGTYGALNL